MKAYSVKSLDCLMMRRESVLEVFSYWTTSKIQNNNNICPQPMQCLLSQVRVQRGRGVQPRDGRHGDLRPRHRGRLPQHQAGGGEL